MTRHLDCFRSLVSCTISLCLVASSICVAVGDDDPPNLPPPANVKVDFVRDIRPIFSKHCYECHGQKTHKAGLRFDRKTKAFAGGDSGPPFEPGKSEESLMIEYVAGLDPESVMPPKEKNDRLSTQEIGLLRAWIDQGASWPEGADSDTSLASMAATTHWAFKPAVRPTLPAVKKGDWVRNPIDAFALAKLEAMDIEPSPEADRNTLIRRLSFDLLGLPPTREEVERFVNDTAPDAYERLVERTLASPHFGERWGRHWLDVARYADSDGYEKDLARPYAYLFRDWVITAFNRDLPFDE